MDSMTIFTICKTKIFGFVNASLGSYIKIEAINFAPSVLILIMMKLLSDLIRKK